MLIYTRCMCLLHDGPKQLLILKNTSRLNANVQLMNFDSSLSSYWSTYYIIDDLTHNH